LSVELFKYRYRYNAPRTDPKKMYFNLSSFVVRKFDLIIL